MFIFTRIVLLSSVFLLAACQSYSTSYKFSGNSDYQSKDSAEKEYVLQQSKNYSGLIEVYKERLKNGEDQNTRFKLAEYYYQVNDYNSSLHYLSVLLQKSPDEHVYLLQAKNLSAQRQYKSAINFINMAINKNPKSGESYNIKGIILAENGQLVEATRAFEMARNLYVKDEIINNNLAMVEIFSQRYESAVRYLLPLYLRGYKEQNLTHNLVFALLKSGDYRYAKEIIEMESMAPYPDALVEALADVSIQPYSPGGSSDKAMAMNSAKTTSASFVPTAPTIIAVGPTAKAL
ncbi:tetratricopeptide repeat protein [Yersinia similis]|uniref:Flp pilus assembly protein TadD, contains TPRrepeat n=1 Tax=Yersinia similis TaxID=367190 RepID=A0A0T9QUE9_9GAMM|nr:hypothetical protein [Yersinia similis]AHK18450.1 tight adherance operon protein [Yersinia similis]CFQ70913.1 Flp pilus assembly protein TadD%2C contains TPRrepeat [Yersinia similis]CNC50444.1 Flp pilus assembly protein TadD%2C contains TPRrepeat [Yersinia similis]CNF56121.1 Flp pilus assembly protein TadD%2C contains TPRrepeat [Yersinia similis]CNF57415.1 Flp pilus assembly protein TadD%2C contains TPRrepeat [Yersinia similis]